LSRGAASTTDRKAQAVHDRSVEQAPVPVLIVDDQASFRRAASVVVDATDGYVLAGQAESGEAALEMLARVPVGLVVMDVHMPGMGGVQAAEEMRRCHPTVRVLLTSIYSRPDELPSVVATSAAVFCRKELFGPDVLDRVWRSRPA